MDALAAQRKREALIEMAVRLLNRDAPQVKKKLASVLAELQLDVVGLKAAIAQINVAWRHRHIREHELRRKYLT